MKPFYYVSAGLLCLGALACSKPPQANLGSPRPPIEAEIGAMVSPTGRLSVSVVIPNEHHAYLDKGKEGVFIPVEFLWADLLKTGKIQAVPKLIQEPKGQYDKEMEAKVLRGPGRFLFAASDTLKGTELSVRTQLCNDRTRVCYPPSTQKVKVSGGEL